jgi:hypothetical protein
VKDAERADSGNTDTVWLVVLELELLLTIRETTKAPGAEYAWLGFLTVLVAPSPKFHCQEVGLPEDVSANCMICPTLGEDGLYTNDAVAAAGTIVIVLFALLEPELFVAMRVIL